MIAEQYEVVVVGGGMSGLCAAIASARGGANTALIQARPMLGGNASSEIRINICGADDHMRRPDARETGILEELLLEHKRRNPTNNYSVFDAILWETAAFQPNLTLHLNTSADGVEMSENRIAAVNCYQQTTEKHLRIEGKLFIDATGDGSIGAWAGADYTTGRESKHSYGETHAPDVADLRSMGNSVMFRAKNVGTPVPFIPPKWANHYTEDDLKNRIHTDVRSGYWWIELGAEDCTADYESIHNELLKTVYGVWDHIKNGGNHGAENMDLEWVGFLPGRRESRRLLGDYVLNQFDCLEGRRFEDAVAYGGRPMDVHTVERFLTDETKPTVWIELDDVYTIPYRCYYSRNIENLFMCGRCISASHMAFSSARVMGTCAVGGQAVGTAAAMAARMGLSPRQMGAHIGMLQQQLLKDDCYIPGVGNEDPFDLALTATVSATQTMTRHNAGNIINGIARTVNYKSNCWAANVRDRATLTLRLAKPKPLQEIRIAFDSNLSRELTISVNEEVLSRQAPGTPPELVRAFTLTLKLDGKVQKELRVEDLYQRHIVLPLEGILCDEVALSRFATHGNNTVKIFEVRLY